jgi:predicted dehydrogenase
VSGPRVVVAGLGAMGRRRLAALLELGVEEIVLLRSPGRAGPAAPSADPALAADPAAELPVATDLDAALAAFPGGPPDALFVCVPATHHLALALPAARAGCHLFLEKPLAAAREGVAELVDEVERRRLVAMVGFDLRFEPGLLRVRELLDRGAVGSLRALRAHVGQYLPDWRPGRDYRETVTARSALGGGVLHELCHELDLALWLAGPAVAVSCRTARIGPLEMDAENLAEIVLDLPGGGLASIHLDCLDRAASRTLRLIGDDGTILWDHHARSVAWWSTGAGASSGAWQRFDYPGHRREERFRREVELFLEALRDGGAAAARPPVDARGGAAVLELVLAAAESARRGTVVRVAGSAERLDRAVGEALAPGTAGAGRRA